MKRNEELELTGTEADEYPVGTIFLNNDEYEDFYDYLIIKVRNGRFNWISLNGTCDTNESFLNRDNERYLLVDNDELLEYMHDEFDVDKLKRSIIKGDFE